MFLHLLFIGAAWCIKPTAGGVFCAFLLMYLSNIYNRSFTAHIVISGSMLVIQTRNLFGRSYEHSFLIAEGRYSVSYENGKESLVIYNPKKYSELILTTSNNTIRKADIESVDALLAQHGMQQGQMIVRGFKKLWRPA
ncbi:hypothetical protein ACE38W_03670 [Chitinophaga sp. Hz27]|uniref:hypothetical protein n=1 Tax=Chitinophaga sp. Hz27 TaxID=3347169 RepID=UPI0035DA866D